MKAPRLIGSVALVLLAGCNGGGGGSGNAKPTPLILEPHELSTHFPGDVDFSGRATDKEDGPLAATALSWQILDADGDVVGGFQGASSTISLLVAGDYTAVLTAEDSDGKKRSVSQEFHLGNTVAELLDPDNHSVLDIAQPFDLDGRAETIANGVTLSTLTFVGIDETTDNEVFRLPVAVPAGLQFFETTVTPTLAAGRFTLHLEVTTNSPAELAEDNIHVLSDAAPLVSITSPADGTHVTPGSSIQFSAIVTDAGGGEPTLDWESSVDGLLSDNLEFTNGSLRRAKHRVTLTATDENGLAGSASVDLYIEDPGTPLFATVTGLPDPDVRSLAVKPGTPDTIWAGTVDGIARYAADTAALGATHTTLYNTNGPGPAQSALCIASGECLFGIGGNGVSIRDAGDTAWTTFAPMTDPNVNGIAQDATTSSLFFATDQGVTETTAARANPVAHDQGTLNIRITSSATDAATTVWAGTEDQGIVRLVLPSSQTPYDQGDGLSDDAVTAMAVDADGIVWIGTDQGLTSYDPVALVFTRYDDPLPNDTVTALAIGDGVVWVGTSNGASRFDPQANSWTTFDGTDLAGRRVNAIAVDTDGGIWFGSGPGNGDLGGLVRYNGL